MAAPQASSRLELLQARFQQKQLQEKEQKLLQLYDQQQQRAYQVVQRGSAGSNGSNHATSISQHTAQVTKTSSSSHTTTSTSQGGKVRQMFDERRQTGVKGIDRSYPLEPLENKPRKQANGNSAQKNGNLTVNRQSLTVKRVARADVNSNLNGGKPVVSYHEEITRESFGPSTRHLQDDDEFGNENHVADYANGSHRDETRIEEVLDEDALERNRMMAKLHLMEYDETLKHRVKNDLESEEFPEEFMVDVPEKLPKQNVTKKLSQAEVRLERFKTANAKRNNITRNATTKKRSDPIFPAKSTSSGEKVAETKFVSRDSRRLPPEVKVSKEEFSKDRNSRSESPKFFRKESEKYATTYAIDSNAGKRLGSDVSLNVKKRSESPKFFCKESEKSATTYAIDAKNTRKLSADTLSRKGLSKDSGSRSGSPKFFCKESDKSATTYAIDSVIERRQASDASLNIEKRSGSPKFFRKESEKSATTYAMNAKNTRRSSPETLSKGSMSKDSGSRSGSPKFFCKESKKSATTYAIDSNTARRLNSDVSLNSKKRSGSPKFFCKESEKSATTYAIDTRTRSKSPEFSKPKVRTRSESPKFFCKESEKSATTYAIDSNTARRLNSDISLNSKKRSGSPKFYCKESEKSATTYAIDTRTRSKSPEFSKPKVRTRSESPKFFCKESEKSATTYAIDSQTRSKSPEFSKPKVRTRSESPKFFCKESEKSATTYAIDSNTARRLSSDVSHNSKKRSESPKFLCKESEKSAATYLIDSKVEEKYLPNYPQINNQSQIVDSSKLSHYDSEKYPNTIHDSIDTKNRGTSPDYMKDTESFLLKTEPNYKKDKPAKIITESMGIDTVDRFIKRKPNSKKIAAIGGFSSVEDLKSTEKKKDSQKLEKLSKTNPNLSEFESSSNISTRLRRERSSSPQFFRRNNKNASATNFKADIDNENRKLISKSANFRTDRTIKRGKSPPISLRSGEKSSTRSKCKSPDFIAKSFRKCSSSPQFYASDSERSASVLTVTPETICKPKAESASFKTENATRNKVTREARERTSSEESSREFIRNSVSRFFSEHCERALREVDVRNEVQSVENEARLRLSRSRSPASPKDTRLQFYPEGIHDGRVDESIDGRGKGNRDWSLKLQESRDNKRNASKFHDCERQKYDADVNSTGKTSKSNAKNRYENLEIESFIGQTLGRKNSIKSPKSLEFHCYERKKCDDNFNSKAKAKSNAKNRNENLEIGTFIGQKLRRKNSIESRKSPEFPCHEREKCDANINSRQKASKSNAKDKYGRLEVKASIGVKLKRESFTKSSPISEAIKLEKCKAKLSKKDGSRAKPWSQKLKANSIEHRKNSQNGKSSTKPHQSSTLNNHKNRPLKSPENSASSFVSSKSEKILNRRGSNGVLRSTKLIRDAMKRQNYANEVNARIYVRAKRSKGSRSSSSSSADAGRISIGSRADEETANGEVDVEHPVRLGSRTCSEMDAETRETRMADRYIKQEEKVEVEGGFSRSSNRMDRKSSVERLFTYSVHKGSKKRGSLFDSSVFEASEKKREKRVSSERIARNTSDSPSRGEKSVISGFRHETQGDETAMQMREENSGELKGKMADLKSRAIGGELNKEKCGSSDRFGSESIIRDSRGKMEEDSIYVEDEKKILNDSSKEQKEQKHAANERNLKVESFDSKLNKENYGSLKHKTRDVRSGSSSMIKESTSRTSENATEVKSKGKSLEGRRQTQSPTHSNLKERSITNNSDEKCSDLKRKNRRIEDRTSKSTLKATQKGTFLIRKTPSPQDSLKQTQTLKSMELVRRAMQDSNLQKEQKKKKSSKIEQFSIDTANSNEIDKKEYRIEIEGKSNSASSSPIRIKEVESESELPESSSRTNQIEALKINSELESTKNYERTDSVESALRRFDSIETDPATESVYNPLLQRSPEQEEEEEVEEPANKMANETKSSISLRTLRGPKVNPTNVNVIESIGRRTSVSSSSCLRGEKKDGNSLGTRSKSSSCKRKLFNEDSSLKSETVSAKSSRGTTLDKKKLHGDAWKRSTSGDEMETTEKRKTRETSTGAESSFCRVKQLRSIEDIRKSMAGGECCEKNGGLANKRKRSPAKAKEGSSRINIDDREGNGEEISLPWRSEKHAFGDAKSMMGFTCRLAKSPSPEKATETGSRARRIPASPSKSPDTVGRRPSTESKAQDAKSSKRPTPMKGTEAIGNRKTTTSTTMTTTTSTRKSTDVVDGAILENGLHLRDQTAETKYDNDSPTTTAKKSDAFVIDLDEQPPKENDAPLPRKPLLRKQSTEKQIPSTQSVRPPSSVSSTSSGSSMQGQVSGSRGKMASRAKTPISGSTTYKGSASSKSGGNMVAADNLVPCKMCGRRFAQDRVTLHEQICAKTGQKKRKTFDTVMYRVRGTDLEPFVKKGLTKKQPERSKKPEVKPNWRRKHEDFINAIRSAKQVQAHLAAGGKLSDLPPPPVSDNCDYIQCPHCGRKFNQAAAERHIPKCEHMLHNKPIHSRAPKPRR